MTANLREFLVDNRETIERRTHDVFLARSVPAPDEFDLHRGIPIFMERICLASPGPALEVGHARHETIEAFSESEFGFLDTACFGQGEHCVG